jgi:hypothetical protein
MEQSKAMEYESRKASSDVLKPRNICMYIYIYTYTFKKDELRYYLWFTTRNFLAYKVHLLF